MAIAGIWSSEPALADLWRIPAGLLLLGLALEGWCVRRPPVGVRLATAPRAFLGRPHAAAFVFTNASARRLAVEYAPALPAGFEPLARVRPRGLAGGARPRRVAGAGAELHQLRGYVRGDPLARIDWKATARAGALVTREFSEDQHLDILVAIDAGRFSRVRAGALDRLGL